MDTVYLNLFDFTQNLNEFGYKFIKIRKNQLAFLLDHGQYFVFQIISFPGKPDDEYIYTSNMELEHVFKFNNELMQRMIQNKIQFPIREKTIKKAERKNYLFYKGITYHYAFEFTISLNNGKSDTAFNVVTSDYRAKTKDFTGMCLENEYKVTSNTKIPVDAFFEIIKEMVDCIMYIDKINNENPNKKLKPLMKVTNREFLNKYEECKRSKKSMDYYNELYKKLKTYMEKPETIQKIKTEEKKFDIIEFPKMIMVLQKIQAEIPQIKDINCYRLSA